MPADVLREGNTAEEMLTTMCPHHPPCPPAQASDHDAARVVASHPEQGWSLLCNGVVVFEDYGELLPDGTAHAAHRPTGHAAA